VARSRGQPELSLLVHLRGSNSCVSPPEIASSSSCRSIAPNRCSEGQDRLAFSDLAVGFVDEIGQHSEDLLQLAGVGRSGGGVGASDIRGDAGQAAAGLGMITMPNCGLSQRMARA
jgi:hypothetical protein